MALETFYQTQSGITLLKLGGVLTRANYRRVLPHLESIADDTGPLRLVILENGFEGWAPEDLEGQVLKVLSSDHFLKKIAVVASPRWRTRLMETVVRNCKVPCRSFDPQELEEAQKWINGQLLFAVPTEQRVAS